MNVEGQEDFPSIDQDDDSSVARIQPGIPKTSLEIEAGISKPPCGDGSGPLTFMGEVLEPFDDDVETVIERKLPLEKDKGLDVDSELDFELKWDDDTDNTNEDQSKSKTDAKVDSSPDSDESRSDNEACKQKMDTVIINATDESLNREEKTTELETVEKLKTIENQADVVDKISVASAKAPKDDAVSEATEVVDTSYVESDTFLNTNVKIGVDSEMSQPVSDNSSLDERLVYSDVEVPEIEDEELLDKLDAQISQADPSLDEEVIVDETVTGETLEEPNSSWEEHNDSVVTQRKLSSEMDVDDIKEKSNTNDNTFASNKDFNTSSYEINKEHKLTNPDVMLEIPTQELIEPFDDSDMSDAVLEYDEDVLLNNDVADNDPIPIKEKLHTIENLRTVNEKEETTYEIQNDNVVNSEPDILEIDDSKVTTTSSEMMDEDGLLQSSSENDDSTNIDVKETDNNEIDLMDVDTENEVSHADIILEPSQLESKVVEETENVCPTDDVESTMTANNINFTTSLSPNLDTDVDNSLSGDREAGTSNKKEITPVVEIIPEIDKEIKENNSSVDLAPKLITEDITVTSEAELPMEINTVKEVIDGHEISGKDVKEITTNPAERVPDVPSEVTSSTGAYTENVTDLKEIIFNTDKPPDANTEVSAEETEGKESISAEADLENIAAVNEVSGTDGPPAAGKEFQSTPVEIGLEVASEGKKVTVAASAVKETPGKEVTKDTAQPSTSKYMQESSDEDQEATDSLGLLAESSRVMDDDDEPEHEDDDDDDDFDQDDGKCLEFYD